ncbi:hypothetical protein MNBD_GAMMA06-2237 [hydrothermal vent metagenome]|uniref:Methylase n=1 Tax=hydrothermal vent metagenome TaxID=652676 RepID=A0A3B0W885_9ZZZZ
MNKPYSESCDQNKAAIFSIIAPVLSSVTNVLEIGSGTGQHALYFAKKIPHLKWHTSDCCSYIEGINMWLDDVDQKNVLPPFELNVSESQWPTLVVDTIFTANTLHIMSDEDVENFISGAAQLLDSQGGLLIYGPFNYDGSFTSESNERFDRWLKDRDVKSGIKNFEEIVSLVKKNGMRLVTDYEMPENNRILHFTKI